mgnify:CR=1 FL=1
MAGYGDDLTRRSEGVMDELFVTCVAITDSAGNSAMLITADLLDAAPHVNLRGAVAKATGILSFKIFKIITKRLILKASYSH